MCTTTCVQKGPTRSTCVALSDTTMTQLRDIPWHYCASLCITLPVQDFTYCMHNCISIKTILLFRWKFCFDFFNLWRLNHWSPGSLLHHKQREGGGHTQSTVWSLQSPQNVFSQPQNLFRRSHNGGCGFILSLVLQTFLSSLFAMMLFSAAPQR